MRAPISANPEYFVHESAYIDQPASIGKGTKIWHFCHVMSNSSIGERCSLGQNVVVASRVVIGNNVKIQNNVSLYEGVTLEDDVFCGPSMVFTNVLTPRSGFPRNRPQDYVKTTVRHDASIGANATIVCGITIGQFALVGAGAVVTKDVPPYSVVFGSPAAVRGYACECGIKLSFAADRAQCSACQRTFTKDGTQVRKIV